MPVHATKELNLQKCTVGKNSRSADQLVKLSPLQRFRLKLESLWKANANAVRNPHRHQHTNHVFTHLSKRSICACVSVCERSGEYVCVRERMWTCGWMCVRAHRRRHHQALRLMLVVKLWTCELKKSLNFGVSQTTHRIYSLLCRKTTNNRSNIDLHGGGGGGGGGGGDAVSLPLRCGGGELLSFKRYYYLQR